MIIYGVPSCPHVSSLVFMSAMVFGGLMGTTSGVTAGLAATDPKLVPYRCDDGDVLYRRRISDCAVGAVPGCQGDARVALRIGDIPTK